MARTPGRWEDGTFKAKDKAKQAAGRKGGKATGEAKARTGATNARFDPNAARRPCCGVHHKRSHKKGCENHRFYIRALRKESIVKNFNDEDYHPSGAVAMFARGCDGTCIVCGKSMRATEAKLIHKEDIQAPSMRVVCQTCA